MKVLVYLETIQGDVVKNSLEVITAGNILGEVTAVMIGTDLNVTEAGEYGASVIYVNQSAESQDEKAAILEDVISEQAYGAVLFPSTLDGKDLAPRLAARFGSCSVTDVTDISGGTLTRPVYGGALSEKICFGDGKKIFATIRKGSFKTPEKTDMRSIEKRQILVERNRIKTTLLKKIDEFTEKADLEGAAIVVAGGRGCKNEETFQLVKELAAVLGAQVGASRPAIESGWISRAHQIGQSGKIISPRLYIACGISGTMQHISGVTNADHIIAVNKDPDAPIFAYADIGIVGDCEKLLPLIISACKGRKAFF